MTDLQPPTSNKEDESKQRENDLAQIELQHQIIEEPQITKRKFDFSVSLNT